MRWDSQKCIARQRGTGRSGPETEGAGKPARGAECHGRHQELGCSGGEGVSAVGKNQERKPSSMECAKLREMGRSLE